VSLALIQPQFAPNLFDLSAMMKADKVVLLDKDVWSRKGRTHRAMIRNEEGSQWINIPILTKDKKKPINVVRIDHSEPWFEAFWNGILHNYSNAMYFDHLQDELYANLKAASHSEKLIDFDLTVFRFLMNLMEVEISFDLASETSFDLNEHSTIYQEYASKNYIRQLEEAETALAKHPEYRQAVPGFESECSCLDLLLNYGGESFKVLELLR
jgi:hypothetical protein